MVDPGGIGDEPGRTDRRRRRCPAATPGHRADRQRRRGGSCRDPPHERIEPRRGSVLPARVMGRG